MAAKEKAQASPAFVTPMATVAVKQLPEGPEWLYEVKFDGYRALILKQGTRVELQSHNHKDLTPMYARENPLPLHMLDSRDFSPVGYQHINKRTGKEVDWKHIVKGYEYKKGDYVVLTDADFKHANVKASETIQIETFCDATAIPYVYYAKPYYLTPAKGGAKVYSLLRQALSATGKVAVATFVMHQREHLCVVASSDSSLMLLTFRFPDEILPVEKEVASARVTSTELSMAKQLIEQMSGKFVPGRFKDTYHSDLKHRVQEKIRNKETHALDVEPPATTERPKAEVIDLMAALKASLSKSCAGYRTRTTPGRSRGRKRA